MPKFFCLFLILCLISWCGATAQKAPVEAIPNQPSPEAYDLLKDSKGYIWVGHQLGVSRYDGANFVTLRHPQQNSIALTDLVEDKKGRIWCHNFSGQIFYIENLQLHLLKEYKFQEEQGYPRITVCGNELVATSTKGFFTYNFLTGKSVYHLLPYAASSLVKVGNKVVLFAGTSWYWYEAGKGLTKLSSNLKTPIDQGFILQNNTLKDTFFLITNPVGIYYKLTLTKDSIRVHEEHKISVFINTISVDKGKTWVHTKGYSFTTDDKDTIEGMNLSSIITDSHGHRWMSSLKKGLCVQYNGQQLRRLDNAILSQKDEIRSLHKVANDLYLGSINGKLYKLNSASAMTTVMTIPKEAGAIERIISFGEGQLLLAASIDGYLYNIQTHSLKHVPLKRSIKDVAFYQGNFYIGTPSGIDIISQKAISDSQFTRLTEGMFNKRTRCRSLTFAHDTLIAGYSDGVYLLRHNTIQPLLYQNAPIYAEKVVRVADRILIGTYTQGLFILESGRLRNLTMRDGLTSNNVRDIKTLGSTTWLIYSDHFQQLNSSFNGVEDFAFPFSKITSLSDFAVLDHMLYIASSDGVYSMRMAHPAPEIESATYIDKIIANGKDLITGNRLKPFQNYLQFQVSTPFFSPYSNITYQYRIKNSPDSSWQRGSPRQTLFDLVALEPGIYDFEIVATDDSRKIVSRPAVYQFEIEPPWYKTWTFRIGMLLLFAGVSFLAVRHYYQDRLRKQRLEYQKILAVQAERQRISSEIHDDIGAGLSAIRLLTELTKNRLPEGEMKQEVGKIHASISELSNKMREVIWSLNTDNDKLDNLLYYIRRQALLLFENSPIQLKVSFPTQEIPAIKIKGEKRRHIYLAVKEALHNCLKHSEAQNCYLEMRLDAQTLHITVADDGKGFLQLPDAYAGNGLPGMKRRMKQMDGIFDLQSQDRTTVTFVIPLNEKHE